MRSLDTRLREAERSGDERESASLRVRMGLCPFCDEPAGHDMGDVGNIPLASCCGADCWGPHGGKDWPSLDESGDYLKRPRTPDGRVPCKVCPYLSTAVMLTDLEWAELEMDPPADDLPPVEEDE